MRGRRDLAGALALALAAAACGADVPPPTGRRVVVVGVDGATWDVMRPMMERGELPAVSGLVARGWSGVLRSLEPMVSESLWTTIATGRVPADHAVPGPLVQLPGGEEAPATSTLRRVETLWTIASRTERTVAVVGWPVTWPVENVAGVMVADRFAALADGHARATVHPAAFRETAEALVMAPDDPARFPLDPVDVTRAAIADHLLRDRPRDLVMVALTGLDVVQHRHWKHHDPDHWLGPGIPAEERAMHAARIADAYRAVDELLARILAATTADDTVLVVSDHGAGPVAQYDPGRAASGDHRVEGIVLAAGPAIRHDVATTPPSVLDVTPTVLHLLGLPEGRDMPGRVVTEMFEPAWARAHRARRIATWESAERAGAGRPVPSPDDTRLVAAIHDRGCRE